MRPHILLSLIVLLALATSSFAGFGTIPDRGAEPLNLSSITKYEGLAPAFDERFGTLATLDSNGVVDTNGVVVLGYSASVRVFGHTQATIVAAATVTTPAAGAFTCVAATNICTDAAHGFQTGLKGQGTTTTTLPAGLNTSTDYFVIYLTADTYSLATSYANAVAGTAIDITDTGTGTHTFTPTAIAGGTAALQGSINGTTWVDIGSTSQNITATANLIYNISSTYYPFARLKFVNTAGVFTSTTQYALK